jgi:hypothetical protein
MALAAQRRLTADEIAELRDPFAAAAQDQRR